MLAQVQSAEISTTSDLPAAWRARANELRRWANEGAARAFECAAEELLGALAREGHSLLTIEESARLVGRHRDTIGNALRRGRLTNHGRPRRPRIRKSELVTVYVPSGVAAAKRPAYDAAADARTLLEGRRGGK
jgi:hypothetical protein